MINLPLGKSLESPIQFKAGTVLFAEGEMSKYLFMIKTGEVRILKTNGKHLNVVKVCKEKEILNEVDILTQQPSAFSAIAKTDIELVLVDQKDILSVIKASPSWVPEILNTLCSRLASTLDIINEHNLMAGEKNSEIVLNKDEEQKYQNALQEYKAH